MAIWTDEEMVALLNGHNSKVDQYQSQADDLFEFPIDELLDDYREVVGLARSIYILNQFKKEDEKGTIY